MSSNGKNAFVIGSSRGIGRGIALKLAEQGSKVAVHYYQNKSAATDTLVPQVKLLSAIPMGGQSAVGVRERMK